MKPISEIAKAIGIDNSEIEPYGHYKAKLSDDLIERVKDNKDGKLILVTAVNPTPAGEGNHRQYRSGSIAFQNRKECCCGSS